jgi:hypothetical protein
MAEGWIKMWQNDSRKRNRELGLLLLEIVIIFSIIASFVIVVFKGIEQSNATDTEPQYGIQGLPYGYTLEKYPEVITDDYIYFTDRVLMVYHNDSTANDYASGLIEGIMDLVPSDISKSVVLVPLRIAYEETMLEYSDDPLEGISEITDSLSGDIYTVDIDNALSSHQEEYIFFRTDPGWTSLAAYYTALSYGEYLELEMMPLETYNEYKAESYFGILAALPKANLSEAYEDYVAFYLLSNGTNQEKVTKKIGTGEYDTFEAPTIALSRGGTNIFMEGYVSHSLVYGDVDNGKTLVVMGDVSGRIFVPWLTPYFENIYYINVDYYKNGAEGFKKIFDSYNVTNFVFVEELYNITDESRNEALEEITKE